MDGSHLLSFHDLNWSFCVNNMQLVHLTSLECSPCISRMLRQMLSALVKTSVDI